MPSTTRSASRTSLPALLLLSVLGAGAILVLIGLFPVLALASVPEEVAAESPAPEPSGELPALPSTGEQQPGGQPPDEWQRELGERPRAGLDPQAAAASLGETPKPPVEGGSGSSSGSGSGSDVVQTGAPAGGQQRPDLITPTAPLHALVENNPMEAPAPVANADADDDKDPGRRQEDPAAHAGGRPGVLAPGARRSQRQGTKGP